MPTALDQVYRCTETDRPAAGGVPGSKGTRAGAGANLSAAAVAVLASGALTAPGAVAQETSDQWRITVAPYVWMTSLDGHITVQGLKGKLNLDFSDVLENLSLAGMLLVDVQKGPWIVTANFVGASLEADATNDIKVTNDVINLGTAIAYQVVDHELRRSASGQPLSLRLAPLAGARVTYLRAELDNDAGPSVDESETWVDPLIGLRADLDLTERVALAAEADVGGFGVGSDLAWNAQLFLTWRTSLFGVATDLALGYRALKQDYDHNDFTYDVTTSGPIIGAAFHF